MASIKTAMARVASSTCTIGYSGDDGSGARANWALPPTRQHPRAMRSIWREKVCARGYHAEKERTGILNFQNLADSNALGHMLLQGKGPGHTHYRLRPRQMLQIGHSLLGVRGHASLRPMHPRRSHEFDSGGSSGRAPLAIVDRRSAGSGRRERRRASRRTGRGRWRCTRAWPRAHVLQGLAELSRPKPLRGIHGE